MAIRKINPDQWQVYFDTFSKSYLKDDQPEYADILILSEKAGVQAETKWLPVEGISYDSKSDLLHIKLKDLSHTIAHPTEIYADEESNGWITSIAITKKDGAKEIIEIR